MRRLLITRVPLSRLLHLKITLQSLPLLEELEQQIYSFIFQSLNSISNCIFQGIYTFVPLHDIKPVHWILFHECVRYKDYVYPSKHRCQHSVPQSHVSSEIGDANHGLPPLVVAAVPQFLAVCIHSWFTNKHSFVHTLGVRCEFNVRFSDFFSLGPSASTVPPSRYTGSDFVRCYPS